MSFLNIENINKTYKSSESTIRVLNNFSLKLDSAMIHAIAGPSGCGKTTLLMLCGALILPDSGKITINKINLTALPANERATRRAGLVGFVFQRFHLVPYLNVEQNIMLSCVARPLEDAEQRCKKLLRQLDLENRRYHIPGKLSAGEQQRTALGRALMNRPALLIADEPTGNLDEKNSDDIMKLLRNFTNEGGTVMVATHDSRVASFADKKYVYNSTENTFCSDIP